jgi:hypothetical protein
VAKALWPSANSLIKPSMTLVEAFMFPGDGQIIATAAAVGVNVLCVAAGLPRER